MFSCSKRPYLSKNTTEDIDGSIDRSFFRSLGRCEKACWAYVTRFFSSANKELLAGNGPPLGMGSWTLPRSPYTRVGPALWVASQAAPRNPSSSWRKNNPRKFWSNSKNISRSKFLKQKDSKNRELALGILSIG